MESSMSDLDKDIRGLSQVYGRKHWSLTESEESDQINVGYKQTDEKAPVPAKADKPAGSTPKMMNDPSGEKRIVKVSKDAMSIADFKGWLKKKGIPYSDCYTGAANHIAVVQERKENLGEAEEIPAAFKKLAKQVKMPAGTKMSCFQGKCTASWYKRGGHGPAKQVDAARAAAEAAGFKGSSSTGGNPDGSTIYHSNDLVHPNGATLSTSKSYGGTKADNRFSITLSWKMPAEKSESAVRSGREITEQVTSFLERRSWNLSEGAGYEIKIGQRGGKYKIKKFKNKSACMKWIDQHGDEYDDIQMPDKHSEMGMDLS
jgi:hypothetical protein